MTEMLSSVRGLQNRYAPVNKLPPEILAFVFSGLMTSLDTLEMESLPLVSPERIKWPVVNRVCRYWRRAALYSPQLWTTIQITGDITTSAACRRFASLSLARSGALPLAVHHRDTLDGINDAHFEDVLPSLPRVQTLVLACRSDDVLRLLTSRADQLETLVIHLARDSDYRDSYWPALFNGWDTPRLQTIHMVGCSAWQEIPSSHLRRLVIIRQTLRPTTLRNLLRILSSNASLEDLILADVEFREEDLDSIHSLLVEHPPIHLSNLKRLYIQGYAHYSPASRLLVLLNQMIVPTTDQWVRHIDYNDSLLEHLHSSESAAVPSPIKSTSIKVSDNTRVVT